MNIPLGKFCVVTGVSGSGKSSLVFDSLYGEAYRRYVESLSSFARQYLKALPKPAIDKVDNLPPAIAVKQARSGGTSRSTVGTMTEISDLMRVLFTYLSEIECPTCKIPVRQETADTIVRDILRDSDTVTVLASLEARKAMKAADLKTQLESQGFTRLRDEKKNYVRIAEAKANDLKSAMVVIDRTSATEENRTRLVDACQTALKLGRGRLVIERQGIDFKYNSELMCNACEKSFSSPSLSLFSFNHPAGACPKCQGFGQESAVDWDKVFPDQSSSLADQGVVAWNFGSHTAMYNEAATSAKKVGETSRIKKSFCQYSEDDWRWLKEGDGKSFEGVRGYFAWLDTKRHKAHYRIHAARFRKYVTCTQCYGQRLNPSALACQIDQQNIAQLSALNIEELAMWLKTAEQRYEERLAETRLQQGVMGLKEAFEEIKSRTDYLQRVGLKYLSIDRQTRTLSGGEQQRINMARCLGSALTETMYCLDEPTAGLHARDSARLLSVLEELRDQGNTVVVVEHEHGLIRAADHLIEIGPESGHKGGKVVYSGVPQKSKDGILRLHPPAVFKDFIKLKNVRTHNLKGVDVQFPMGALTTVCGVSGSGKTSLIQHTLYPMLAKALRSDIDGYVSESKADGIGPRQIVEKCAQVVHVSQTNLGRSSRSNIATYLGVYEEIRKILAQTPRAQQLGLGPGAFSFNSAGGRCETCRGLGTIVEDLSFLGEMEVTCGACQGKRFSEAVLSVEYKSKNLSTILRMTIDELRELFFEFRSLVKILDSVIAMGLGYVTVGQTTSSFSGGEAQRLKLLRLLSRADTSKPSVLIFDEPTTGLSDHDVAKMIEQFRGLTRQGHTLIIVEHHLQVVAASDWVVEVGPDAADRGGEIVYQGSVSGLLDVKESPTALFLLKRVGTSAQNMDTNT